MIGFVFSHEVRGLLYIMSGALIYLILPVYINSIAKRKALFILILGGFSIFYLTYEQKDPYVYIFHLIPVSLTLTVLFEGWFALLCTFAVFNFGSHIVLHNDFWPVVLSTGALSILGFWAARRVRQRNISYKNMMGTAVILIYFLVLVGMDFELAKHPFFLLALPGTIISSWFINYMYFNVKTQEIIRERLINAEKYHLIGQLAASISHEIRNPLTSIRGLLQLLRRGNTPREKALSYIDLAISEVDQANAIISDYLNYAKPSVDRWEKIDAKDEMSELLSLVTTLSVLSKVEIILTFGSNDPLYITGESKKFKQCMLNIIKNSIEAMPDGGLLTVDISRSGDTVRITVEDTGIGMTKDQIKSLGYPFYTTKDKGTGLGLMVVMSLVKTMNGKISYKSKPQKGTVCIIEFKECRERKEISSRTKAI